MNGLLILFASPSGGGKTTVIHKLIEKFPDKFVYSVSSTTRTPRPNEIDGKDYLFLSVKEFQKRVRKNQFLEWEEVHGYYYGTDMDFINRSLKSGKNVLLDLDVNGSLAVAKKFDGKVITIFLTPPSLDELVNRLQNRKTDSKEDIKKRLTRIPMEMEKSKHFDYIIQNDNLETTVNKVLDILLNFKK